MIQTPTKRIVDAKWSIFNGKIVDVISSAQFALDGQEQYNCSCEIGRELTWEDEPVELENE